MKTFVVVNNDYLRELIMKIIAQNGNIYLTLQFLTIIIKDDSDLKNPITDVL